VTIRHCTDLSEPVEERPRQTLAPTALMERVLAGKQSGGLVLDVEGARELRDVHLPPVVQARVQALQH